MPAKAPTESGTGLALLNAEIVACRRCPRLVQWREQVARSKRRAYVEWEYWGKPVPGFGDPSARILVVGLAPGAHGSNRTGRQFTGDASGKFLFPALHRAGFASQPIATSRDDGMKLKDLYITATARCVPPGNRPSSEELDNCQRYLEREIQWIAPRVIVCLGRIAFDRVKRILMDGAPLSGKLTFGHGCTYRLQGGIWLIGSYHPSQQNTLTGRLTRAMFARVWSRARLLAEES
jgi:uracil-DNA glycosylase family 4